MKLCGQMVHEKEQEIDFAQMTKVHCVRAHPPLAP